MRVNAQRNGDESLAVRAAWLHYSGGLTQAAVAKRLGIASVKAHRLISRANHAGLVKVTIDGDITECVELEDRLAHRYGLDYCEVAPDLLEEGLPLRALGASGASYLRRELDSGRNAIIGFGHGRTLAAIVDQLPHREAGNAAFVSLLGGLNQNFAANPHDVMHRLANKTGAAAYFMPVPIFANTARDREVLLAQRGVRDVLDMGLRSELKIVGIGTAKPHASLVSSGMIQLEEIADVIVKGGVGELLGTFFDKHGEPVDTALTGRALSVGPEVREGTRIVGIAGGAEKIEAIRAVLESGRLSGLITDERTAMALAKQT
ncbi:MAG: sugar-binding transcriptional regulator [Alphaproteobacteria bacterium]|nr:sugar-binding transcriptional regulator [Alphaproteobacteria bacterium]